MISGIIGLILAICILPNKNRFGAKIAYSEAAYEEVADDIESLKDKYLFDTTTSNHKIQVLWQRWQTESNQILKGLALDTLVISSIALEQLQLSEKDTTAVYLSKSDTLRKRNYRTIEKSSEVLLNQVSERIEKKKKHIFSSIITALVSLFFSCFAGLAFIFIYKDSNELIQSKKVILYNDKKNDEANLFLSAALTVWVIIDLLVFYKLFFHQLTEVLWLTIISLASTINSFFFLRAMLEFDYKPPGPIWKNYNWYRNGLGNKKVILTITLGAIGLTILIGAFIARIGDENLNWGIRIPDMILSLITITLLGLHLRSAFVERGKREYNVLVLLTLALVLLYQILPLPIFRSSNLIQGVAPILSALYRILLISLFLFLSFSWVDFFRGRRLTIEKEQIEKERATQYKAYKRVSHRLNNFLTTHLGGTIHAYENTKEVKSNKRFSEIMKSLGVYTSTLIEIHNTVETKKDGKTNKSLYKFLQDLKIEFEQLFSGEENHFYMGIHEECKNIYNDEEDHIFATFIGTCLNELITNANKHRKNDSIPKWVSVEIKVIKNILHISVSDKNQYFDLEAIIKQQKEEKDYHGITIIDGEVNQRGGKFDKSGKHEVGNRVNIYYPITRNFSNL